MNRILITGSDGFIGKNLIPRLIGENYSIITKSINDGDIAEESTWHTFPPASVVIHLAAKTFVPASWQNSFDFYKCNFLGTIAALNYCQAHNAKLIFLSTYLYGNPSELPINESAELKPSNPYALSKKIAEDACKFYAESLCVKVIILRLFNLYGPHQSDTFLIQTIILQIQRSQSINVMDLEPKRDFIYIDDAVEAIVKAITYDTPYDVFNIGSGKSYSVAEIINIIQHIFNTNLPIISKQERRKDEIMNTVADILKAKKKLGWIPKIDFETGLRRIIMDFI